MPKVDDVLADPNVLFSYHPDGSPSHGGVKSLDDGIRELFYTAEERFTAQWDLAEYCKLLVTVGRKYSFSNWIAFQFLFGRLLRVVPEGEKPKVHRILKGRLFKSWRRDREFLANR